MSLIYLSWFWVDTNLSKPLQFSLRDAIDFIKKFMKQLFKIILILQTKQDCTKIIASEQVVALYFRIQTTLIYGYMSTLV